MLQKRFFAALTAAALTVSSIPAGFAQSVSSSSSSVSSVSSASSVSSSSSSSSSSSLSSSSLSSSISSARSSSTSSYRRGSYRQSSMAAVSSPRGANRSSARSVPVQTGIPQQCRGLVGRALSSCITRLNHSGQGRSVSSLRSSASSTSSVGATATGTGKTLWNLLFMSKGELTDINLMRQMCMLIMNDPTSTCAQGSNLRLFNEATNTWWMRLSDAVKAFMIRLNGPSSGGDSKFFWHSVAPGGFGGDDASVSSMSSMSSVWWSSASSASQSLAPRSARNLNQEAWDACSDRDPQDRSRCVGNFLRDSNSQSVSSGVGSSSSRR